jgi:transcriptional regulator with AAA-type ATPase domain
LRWPVRVSRLLNTPISLLYTSQEMTRGKETIEDEDRSSESDEPARPGLVLVFAAAQPMMRVVELPKGGITLGRDDVGPLPLPDERASRQHAQVSHSSGRFVVRDLGSRNGTWLGGRRLAPEGVASGDAVLRLGQSVLLLCDDVTPLLHQAPPDMHSDVVAGPRVRHALEQVQRAAKGGDSLLIGGESGSGKELAARAFHNAGTTARGPFVAVNCAAIPEGIAERLLFGARRGAFSGATTDAEGYVESADGGTLFLDEIGELDAQVQAKLLRVLETREVVPLGASRPRPVDIRLCAATHRNLRQEVAAGRFREDLYFRIGRPEVILPPLRARKEDMPYLVARELFAVDAGLSAHASLVEAVCLRPWPGNVRELLKEVRRAALEAQAAGSTVVGEEHLDARAGLPLMRTGHTTPPQVALSELDRPALERAIEEAGGNLSAAARALGLHRTQLYRLMKKHGMRAADDSPPGAADE